MAYEQGLLEHVPHISAVEKLNVDQLVTDEVVDLTDHTGPNQRTLSQNSWVFESAS